MNGIRIDPQLLLLERCRCGLSQAALARKARLAYLTVSRIERGQATRVQAVTAYKLAVALELDIEALMSPATPPAPLAEHGEGHHRGGRRRVRADDPPSARAT